MIDFVHNFQVFLPSKYEKDAQCSETNFCETNWGLALTSARLGIQTLTSEVGDLIQQHAGPGAGAHGGGECGG